MQTQTDIKDTHRAIAQAREALKMSQRDFADALSVSHNSVHQWENGIAEPTTDRLSAWLKDQRAWVQQLATRLIGLKYGQIVLDAATTEPQKAA